MIARDAGWPSRVDLEVYDKDGQEIGYIDQASDAQGWMQKARPWRGRFTRRPEVNTSFQMARPRDGRANLRASFEEVRQ